MSGGRPADGLPPGVRLPPGEALLWTGRPVPKATATLTRADLAVLALALLPLLVLAALGVASSRLRAALGVTALLTIGFVLLWLAWRDRHERGWSEPTDRYLVTSERVVVLKEEEAFFARGPRWEGVWIVGLDGGLARITSVVPLERHALRADVVGWGWHDPHVVLRLRGRLPWDAFVLPSPDDPEGALRAMERMMAASPTPDAEPA